MDKIFFQYENFFQFSRFSGGTDVHFSTNPAAKYAKSLAGVFIYIA